jgi:hypothetical protein
MFYPTVDAEQSQRDYLKLRQSNFSPEAVLSQWSWNPYVMHMHMRDHLKVGEEFGIE